MPGRGVSRTETRSAAKAKGRATTRKQSLRQRLSPKERLQALVSGIVLFAALYLILSGAADSESQKWAFGTIGLILGFWLKSDTV